MLTLVPVRIRKTRGSVRIFAGRTNALPFTPKNQLIDARNSPLRLCKFTLFIHFCAPFTSVSFTAGIQSLKSLSSLFLFLLPHIFNLIHLHTLPSQYTSTSAPPCYLPGISVYQKANAFYLITTAWLSTTRFRLVMTSYDHQTLLHPQTLPEPQLPPDTLAASCKLRANHSTTHEEFYSVAKQPI